MKLEALLAAAKSRAATDIHLMPGQPPFLRLSGHLVSLSDAFPGQGRAVPLSPLALEDMLHPRLDGDTRTRLEATGECDCAFSLPDGGRVRAALFRVQGQLAAVLRLLPDRPPTLTALAEGPAFTALEHLTHLREGLVLITGPTGSGKSTTLAALVSAIAARGGGHVLSVEDPVEYVLSSAGGVVTQRVVGQDTKSFESGLTAALRADPDVLVIGEIRDAGPLDIALRAAATGHLVLATLHAPGAARAIDRVIEMVDAPRQPATRAALANGLEAVVAQRLVTREGDGSRGAVFEILRATPAVRTVIRDGETRQIPNLIAMGRSQGMVPLDA